MNNTEYLKNDQLYDRIQEVFIFLLKEQYVSCQFNFENIEESVIEELFHQIESDGYYLDRKRMVVIWDGKIKKQYKNLITTTCDRRCCHKKSKGSCSECQTSKILSNRLIHSRIIIQTDEKGLRINIRRKNHEEIMLPVTF